MASQSSLTEKRRFKRRSCETKASLLYDGVFSFEVGCELGEGGMLLKTKRPLRVTDLIEVSFRVPGGSIVSSTAEVLYTFTRDSDATYFGLRFIHPTDVLKNEIRQFVEKDVTR